jgi:hypothetical protein
VQKVEPVQLAEPVVADQPVVQVEEDQEQQVHWR